MAQWVAIGITALAFIVSLFWRRKDLDADAQAAWRRDMEDRIRDLEDSSQTPGERDALAKVLEIKFTGHEAEDNLRFKYIDEKLDLILKAVSK